MSLRHVTAVYKISLKQKFNVRLFPSHTLLYYFRDASHDLDGGLDRVMFAFFPYWG